MKRWTPFQFNNVANENKTKNKQKNKPASLKLKAEKNVINANIEDFFKAITPQKPDDLAVHTKKLEKLEEWLKLNILRVKEKQSLLLITGPTGCAKTTALRVLCQKHNIDIKEWINTSSHSNYRQNDYESTYTNQADQFCDFLVECKYKSMFSKCVTQICLVKEYPNVFLKNPEEFFTSLETISEAGNVRVVFMATDDGAVTNIDRNLFPDMIKTKFSIDVISFNACSATLIKAAMKRAQKVVQAMPKLYKTPSDDVIEAICNAGVGDIRFCSNQFYLAAVQGSESFAVDIKTQDQITETKTGVKRKRTTKTVSLKTKLKDEALGLFHSVGRVLNPKIDPVTKKIHHDLEALIDEFSTQPNMFLNFLQENFVRYFGDMTDAMYASTHLSLSRCLLDKWTMDSRDLYIIGLYIAVMGLMLHNKHRVSAWTPIRGPTKLKVEEVTFSRTDLRPVLATDLCYYNLLVKNEGFDRFGEKGAL